ncbi:MAG: polymerase [Frankiaceae bacterium]|jgi:DNA polymerase-4|nr:polymerase [Frankiaceae bacterium]
MSRRQLERRPDDAQSRRRGDDTGCSILHVDMDAFYASVELRERPELVGRPVIVGGLGGRSVVLSATYEARGFGVHSAMPMARARRLCPQATVIPPTPGVYAEASRGVMEIFRSITPLVEPLSLDEAFLDVAGARRRLGTPAQIGDLIRARVADEQRLPCSVGVASTKFLAKLASGRAKPDGLLVVPRDGIVEFLHPLPIGALWGVGERAEEALSRLGLRTIGDIADTPEATLARALGPAVGASLSALAWGRDDRAVVPHEPDRSIGAEETFARDVEDPVVVRRELLRLAERTAARLRQAGHVGRTVSIKVRFADFTTITRSKTMAEPTDVARVVYDTAKNLYDALRLDRARIRLVGVRVEGLADAVRTPRQLAMDGGGEEWRAAERAADQAVARFGAGAVRPAALVDREQRDRDRSAASRDDDTTVW